MGRKRGGICVERSVRRMNVKIKKFAKISTLRRIKFRNRKRNFESKKRTCQIFEFDKDLEKQIANRFLYLQRAIFFSACREAVSVELTGLSVNLAGPPMNLAGTSRELGGDPSSNWRGPSATIPREIGGTPRKISGGPPPS
jgi:hypothetical protein